MYDELIKRLHREAVYLPEKFSKNAELLDVLMKAADAIEELSMKLHGDEAAIAGMKREIERMVVSGNMPRWIPVTERLPELGKEVLVYYHWINPPEKGSIARDSMHIHDISMKPVWKKHLGGKVTHWMPLPEPPKEE